jgi:hypothetical protein
VAERLLLKRGAIRVFDDGLYWEWAGRRRRPEDYDAEAHIEDLADVPARDLAAALRRYRDLLGEVAVTVYTDGTADDDLEYMSPSPVSLNLIENDLVMTLDVYTGEIPTDEQPAGQAAERVAPVLSRKRMWLVSGEEDLDDAGRWWHVRLIIGFYLRGQSVADVVHDGLELVELINATERRTDANHMCRPHPSWPRTCPPRPTRRDVAGGQARALPAQGDAGQAPYRTNHRAVRER